MKKVLWVEDDPLLSQMLSEKLRQEGYDAKQATDGKMAIELVSSERPDIVLLDIILPDINGLEVLETIKSNPETKDIPVLILSNLSSNADKEKGLKLGAVDFLVKSNVLPNEIMDRIRKIVG